MRLTALFVSLSVICGACSTYGESENSSSSSSGSSTSSSGGSPVGASASSGGTGSTSSSSGASSSSSSSSSGGVQECDETCVCQPNDTCSLECGATACTLTVGKGAMATINLSGGDAEITCEADSSCAIDGGSGKSKTTCHGRCSIDCGSGDCAIECVDGAQCLYSEGTGTATCTGIGCRKN